MYLAFFVFQEELAKILEQAAKDNKLVVIDFYATWCAPCKMIAPNIEELDNVSKKILFAIFICKNQSSNVLM